MEFTKEQLSDIGVALNEATLVGVRLDLDSRCVWLTFSVLALPPNDGPPPSDPRVQIILKAVGRIAASLRHGNWDDAEALVEPFEVDRLAEIVASFEQQAVYGWNFLDVPDADDFTSWSGRLSLDWRSEPGGLSHTLTLFQEGGRGARRHLDIRFWFDVLGIRDPDQREVAFDVFTAAGIRWWDAMYARDPRTSGQSIVPARGWPDAE